MEQQWNQVRYQVCGQIRDQAGERINSPVCPQVRDQVWEQVDNQIWSYTWLQVSSHIRDTLKERNKA